MAENNVRRLSFSSLNPQLILHRHSSADHHHLSGISTPPLQSPASVPFKWEHEPGKPRPVTRFEPQPGPTLSQLEPPPCRTMHHQLIMMNMDYSAPKITQSPSPHSILDGPYNMGRPMFSSSRFSRDGPDPFEGTPNSLLGGKRGRRRGLLGKLRVGGNKREGDGGILGFSLSSSSSFDSDERGMDHQVIDGGGRRKMRRHATFHHLSAHQNINKSTHIWASICGGLKHVVHWKSSWK